MRYACGIMGCLWCCTCGMVGILRLWFVLVRGGWVCYLFEGFECVVITSYVVC